MTAVVAESNHSTPQSNGEQCRSLDFWGDLAATGDRAGGAPERLWVDDSKLVFRGRKGRDRLERASLAVLHAAGHSAPVSIVAVLGALGAGTLEEAELARWLEPS